MRLGGAPSDVAAGHVQLIKVLPVLKSMDLRYCFYSHYFADIKNKHFSDFDFRTRAAETRVSAEKLINSLFPLHVLHYLGCKYVSSLEASSLEEKLEAETEHKKSQK